MNPQNIPYFIKEGMINISRNKLANLLTVLTISTALSMFGIFLIVYLNLASLLQSWGEYVRVTIYLKDDATEEDIKHIKGYIQGEKAIKESRFISKEEAMEEFRKSLKEKGGLLEGIDRNPLPASFELRLETQSMSIEFIRSLSQRLSKLDGVDEVQHGEEWLSNLVAFLNLLKIAGSIIGVLFALAIIFIISSTIRLSLYAREEEIGIMKLLGATNGFIKAPFIIEGMLQGAVGGIIAILILNAVYHLFTQNLILSPWLFLVRSNPSFLPYYIIAGLILVGPILGIIGSLSSINRFLRVMP